MIYPPILKPQLKSIGANYHSLIRESIQKYLQFEPEVETRNRKPLKRPIIVGAKWELRFGPKNRFRVYYRIDFEQRQVFVLAIGEKIRDRLLIGGEEIEK